MATNTNPTVRFTGFERTTRGLVVRFNVIAPAGYVMATCASGYAFRSYGAAIKGARRALASVEATGRFPNMCDRF